MFGIVVDGHPHLTRILMPKTWMGHPLRKDHPARATEMGPFELPDEKEDAEQEALRFRPEEWGMKRSSEDADFIFLNVGPQHPGTHGILRVVLQLDGEEIVDVVPEIGFHHRGAEKMGERQSWHTYIPYTDRIDYLGGVMNNLAYLTAVEKLAGITVPPRAQVIRVMLSRTVPDHQPSGVVRHVCAGPRSDVAGLLHLQRPRAGLCDDRGDLRRADASELVPHRRCGTGSAKRLGRHVSRVLAYFPPRLKEYDREVLQNRIFKARTKGVGVYTLEEAIDWGVTGPNLRACGFEWDFRKKQPYSGYDQFDFDIPTATHGDCYDRAVVRVEEMRQSVRIIEQCVKNMPDGPYNRLNRSALHRSRSGPCTTSRL